MNCMVLDKVYTVRRAQLWEIIDFYYLSFTNEQAIHTEITLDAVWVAGFFVKQNRA